MQASFRRIYMYSYEKFTLQEYMIYYILAYIIYSYTIYPYIHYKNIHVSFKRMYRYPFKNIQVSFTRMCLFYPQSLRQSWMTTGPPLYWGPMGYEEGSVFYFCPL